MLFWIVLLAMNLAYVTSDSDQSSSSSIQSSSLPSNESSTLGSTSNTAFISAACHLSSSQSSNESNTIGSTSDVINAPFISSDYQTSSDRQSNDSSTLGSTSDASSTISTSTAYLASSSSSSSFDYTPLYAETDRSAMHLYNIATASSDGNDIIWFIDNTGTPYVQATNVDTGSQRVLNYNNDRRGRGSNTQATYIQATNPLTGRAVLFIMEPSNNQIIEMDANNGNWFGTLSLSDVRSCSSFRTNADGSLLAFAGPLGFAEPEYIDVHNSTTMEKLYTINMFNAIEGWAQKGFTFGPDSSIYVPTRTRYDSSVYQFHRNGTLMQRHRVTFDLEAIVVGVDGNGTIGMLDCAQNRVAFQPMTSTIQPSSYEMYPKIYRRWCRDDVTFVGNKFAITNPSTDTFFYFSLVRPVPPPPPISSSSSSSPPISSSSSSSSSSSLSSSSPPPEGDYIEQSSFSILLGNIYSYTTFIAASRNPSQPDRLFYVDARNDFHLSSVNMTSGQSYYPQMGPSSESLDRCNVTGRGIRIRSCVPLNDSIMVYSATSSESNHIMQLDYDTGDCIRSWTLDNYMDGIPAGLGSETVAVDEHNQRFAAFTSRFPDSYPLGVLSLFLMATGEIIASTQLDIMKITFYPDTGDYYAGPNWSSFDDRGRVTRLNGNDLSVVQSFYPVGTQSGAFLIDQTGTLFVAQDLGLRCILPNGTSHFLNAGDSYSWQDMLTTTIDQNVVAVKYMPPTTWSGGYVGVVFRRHSAWTPQQPFLSSSSSVVPQVSSSSSSSSSSSVSSSSAADPNEALSSSSSSSSYDLSSSTAGVQISSSSVHSDSSSGAGPSSSSGSASSSSSILSSSSSKMFSSSGLSPTSSASSSTTGSSLPSTSHVSSSTPSTSHISSSTAVLSSTGSLVPQLSSSTGLLEGDWASSKQLSGESIAGIVVGVIVAVILVALAICLFLRLRKVVKLPVILPSREGQEQELIIWSGQTQSDDNACH